MFPRVQLKQLARTRLQTSRLNPILVVLIATLLGGVASGGGFNFNFGSDSDAADSILSDIGGVAPRMEDTVEGLFGGLGFLLGIILVAVGVALLVAILFNIFVSNVVGVGLQGWFLRFMRGEDVSVGELFASFRIYRPAMVTKLLTSIYTFLWSLLFIIPGIVKGYAYSMADYIIYENPNLSADRAIQMSEKMTDGYKGDLFLLNLSFIGWQILSALTAGILGVVYVDPYVCATHAAAYEFLKAEAINNGRLTWEDFGQLPPSFEPPADVPPVDVPPAADIYPTDTI